MKKLFHSLIVAQLLVLLCGFSQVSASGYHAPAESPHTYAHRNGASEDQALLDAQLGADKVQAAQNALDLDLSPFECEETEENEKRHRFSKVQKALLSLVLAYGPEWGLSSIEPQGSAADLGPPEPHFPHLFLVFQVFRL